MSSQEENNQNSICSFRNILLLILSLILVGMIVYFIYNQYNSTKMTQNLSFGRFTF